MVVLVLYSQEILKPLGGKKKTSYEGIHSRRTTSPSPGCSDHLCILCNYVTTRPSVASLSSTQSLYYGYSCCATNLNMLLPYFQRPISLFRPPNRS